MAISWTLLFVRFDFGGPALPDKAALEIARMPFSQVRYGKYPYRAHRLCRMDILEFTGSSARKTQALPCPGRTSLPARLALQH
jgi:hypothetical protein